MGASQGPRQRPSTIRWHDSRPGPTQTASRAPQETLPVPTTSPSMVFQSSQMECGASDSHFGHRSNTTSANTSPFIPHSTNPSPDLRGMTASPSSFSGGWASTGHGREYNCTFCQRHALGRNNDQAHIQAVSFTDTVDVRIRLNNPNPNPNPRFSRRSNRQPPKPRSVGARQSGSRDPGMSIAFLSVQQHVSQPRTLLPPPWRSQPLALTDQTLSTRILGLAKGTPDRLSGRVSGMAGRVKHPLTD